MVPYKGRGTDQPFPVDHKVESLYYAFTITLVVLDFGIPDAFDGHSFNCFLARRLYRRCCGRLSLLGHSRYHGDREERGARKKQQEDPELYAPARLTKKCQRCQANNQDHQRQDPQIALAGTLDDLSPYLRIHGDLLRDASQKPGLYIMTSRFVDEIFNSIHFPAESEIAGQHGLNID